MFTALLDTCVLWPSKQRNFLLSLAAEGSYRPVWSAAILDEVQYTERKKLARRGFSPEEAARAAARLVAQMREAFFGAEVEGWELVTKVGLPDPGDEHVLAAALIGGAEALVTDNDKDFPNDLVPKNIRVMDPVTFAYDMVAVDPARGLRAVEQVADRSGRTGPKLTIEDLLGLLASRYKMRAAVDLMREVASG